jgi:serine/threonine-protein kinase
MASVWLATDGRLLGLSVVPPQLDESPDVVTEPDWAPLFEAAGLDEEAMEVAEPTWTPSVYADRRAAWTGTYGEGGEPIRIEAGAYRGHPVAFLIVMPWTRASRMIEEEVTAGEKFAQFLFTGLFFLIPLTGGLLLARRNLKMGRSDRRGAFRIAAFYVIVHMIVWIFTAKHVPTPTAELTIFVGALGSSMWQAGLFYTLYVALEPYVRRRWPEALVSWSRVLAGRFRDPLVGRDILVGAAAAVSLQVLGAVSALAPAWFGRPPAQPDTGDLTSFLGVPRLLANTVDALVHAQVPAMVILFAFLLFRLLLRNQWLAAGVLVGLFMLGAFLLGDNPWLAVVSTILVISTILFTLTRFGLLAATIMFYFMALLDFPLTSNLSAWHAGATVVPVVTMVALAAYGFYLSLAGRPLFAADLFQE